MEKRKEKSELEWYDFIELLFGIILCAGLWIIVIAFIISAIVWIIQWLNQTF